jgi:outer membrane protein OmpA-like peptidoglycan-associated protein
MKNTYKFFFFVFVCIIANSALSQNRYLKQGNKHFYKFNYLRASDYYEAIDNKSIDVERNLAKSYNMIGDLDNAEATYDRIIKNPQANFQDFWNYFQVLLKKSEYELAVSLLDTLYILNPLDSRVKMYLDNKDFYKNLLSNKYEFLIRNLQMNTAEQDFGTVYFKDNQVVYTSSKRSNSVVRSLWPGNQLKYLNLYSADIDDNDELVNRKIFKKNLRKKYHDGPVSFNRDFSLMAITRNNYGNKASDGTRNLQLFISEFIDGQWSSLVAFPYNNPEYSIGQACFSNDGKYLYFISDMPGGKGGTDIYRIERRKDKSWGALENLESINTEGNEMFPYIHSSGMFFFSSDGHPGLGGLDIFMSKLIDGIPHNIKNIGFPLNSNRDDFAFMIDKDLLKAYFSSNRSDAEGSDDIYFASTTKPLKINKLIKGVSKDLAGNIIPSTQVFLYLDSIIVEVQISDSLGRYSFEVEKDTIYDLKGEKVEFIDGFNFANTDVPDPIVYADLVLLQPVDFSLKVIIKDRSTDQIIEGAKIQFTDNMVNEKFDEFSNNLGFHKKTLDNKVLFDRISYNFVVSKENYITSFMTYNQVLDRVGEFVVIIKLENMLKNLSPGDDLAKHFDINPIYFDFDKSNIRPDAAIELDKIVQIMNTYPSMIVELGSHTDCRASNAYNLALSDRRAKSSAQYIRQRISNPERIFGKGYGEHKLVNECECEGNLVVPCTEEQHQMNRRTEFIIIRFDPKYGAQPVKGVQSDREYDAQNVKERMKSNDEFFPDESIVNQSKVIIDFDELNSGWYVVVETLNSGPIAVESVLKFQNRGYANSFIVKKNENNNTVYNVVLKSFSSIQSANIELEALKKNLNNPNLWILEK